MNVGEAIMSARRADRQREVEELLRSCSPMDRHRLLAYWWWGWAISGRGGFGRPGREVGRGRRGWLRRGGGW